MSLNIYNPTTQQLTEVAGLDVKDSLEKVATLPTPTADYLNQVYILVGTQEGYHVGSIYQCRYINSAYTWVEITGSVVGKADKAPNATNNHLAKLTADGNLADSGIAVGDLGTAINKNWTDLVRPNSHDLVESNAVYSAITNAISSIYTPHGDVTCAELVPALLIDENIGNVYTVTDSGTTTAYFMQGAGKTINTGDSVSIIKAGATSILFNLMGNVLDLTDYQKKNLTTPLTIGDTTQTTVEGALGALNTTKATQAEVDDMNNVLGAKNLLPNKATSQTFKGITWTVNSDGSITANGTADGGSYIRFVPNGTDFSKILPSNAPLTISCECSDDTLKPSSYSTYFALFSASGSGTEKIIDTVISGGHGVTKEFTVQDLTFVNTYIQIANGITVNNVTFKPMIRLASDPDDTYVPYTMTNKQITDVIPSNVSSSNKLVVENYLLEDTSVNDPVTILTNNIGSFRRGTYNVTVKTSRWSYGITLFMWSSAYWSAIVQSYGNDTLTEKVVCSNGTVTRQKLVTDNDIKSVQVPIADVAVNAGTTPYYYKAVSTGVPTTATVIGFKEGGNWDEKVTYSISATNNLLVKYYGNSAYTIPSGRMPITIYYIE